MPRPGMFTQGHINGLTNEIAAQITSQTQLSDKVANRHPFSVYNAERRGAFYEQRPRDFSTQYGYGFPIKIFDRNSGHPLPSGLAPFPPGYTGHVPESAPALGETFGRMTKAKVNSNMAPRPESPVFQSTSHKTYGHPRDLAERAVAPPPVVKPPGQPPRHYDAGMWRSTAQLAWNAPPATAYLPPRLRVNLVDEYGEVVPTEKTCAIEDLPRTKQLPPPRRL